MLLTQLFCVHTQQLGAAGLIVIALITNHCCELIIKCKNAAVKLVLESVPQYRELQEEGCTEEIKQIKENIEREMSLGDISLIALGPWGIRIVNVALVLTQTGFCVAYFIFMGNTLVSMFPVKFKAPLNTPNVTATVTTLFATLNDSNTVILGAHRLHQSKPALPCSGCTAHSMLTNSSTYNTALTGETTAPNFALLELIPLPFLILMAFIRNLRKLGPISAIANVALLTAFFGVLGYMLNGELHYFIFSLCTVYCVIMTLQAEISNPHEKCFLLGQNISLLAGYIIISFSNLLCSCYFSCKQDEFLHLPSPPNIDL